MYVYVVSPHYQLYNDDINLNGTYATYLVVAAWDGAILAARPVTDLDGRGMTRFDAVKLADPDTVLACSNVGATEEGYVHAWKWRSDDAPTRLNDLKSASSHDVQLAADGAYYWQPQYVSIAKRRVDDGETVAVYDVCPDPGGMNHAQLLDDDARALVSCRYDDSVVLYDVARREEIWRAGGADATLATVDARGDPEAWSGPGQQKGAKFPTSKAQISAVFHSFRLIFGRAIISRNGLEARMLFPERARAEHSR